MNKLKNWKIGLLGCLALGLLGYSGYKSATLSMTHDESSTYLNYIDQPLAECFYDPVCWGTANLHLVNSFCMQGGVAVGGPKEFFVRIGSVLAHILYISFSLLLVVQLSSSFWVRLGTFSLLNGSPYLLDFFSLGRGYGLACGFTMVSYYYLWTFHQKESLKSLTLCLIAAVLAVLSNFTFLNFYAPLMAWLGLVAIIAGIPFLHHKIGKGLNQVSPVSVFGMLAGVSIVLAGLLFYPISFLQQLGEFDWGVGSLAQSFQGLMKDNLQNQAYLGSISEELASGLVLLLAILSVGWGLWHFSQKGFEHSQFYAGVSFISVLFIGALITQYYLLGTQYLINRKALIFIPLFGLPFALFMVRLEQHQPLWGKVLGACVAVFFIWHLTRTANFRQVREWYYDAYTKDMVLYTEQQVSPGDTLHLGVYWIYSHSANFYRQTRKISKILPISYEKQLRSDTLYDFYYVEPGQKELLHPRYQLEKKFGYVGELYRKQPLTPAE